MYFGAFCAILFSSSLLYAQAAKEIPHLVRVQSPPTLSFHDLVTLASVDPPPAELQSRLTTLLSEPFISNEAAFEGAKPIAPRTPGIGRVLRIAEWNINRLDKGSMLLALGDLDGFETAARRNRKLHRRSLRAALDQVRDLQGADVLVLDEIDDGVGRSGYRNVPRDIARLLHMNYVYGTEFVELNPLYLGVNKMDILDLPRQRREAETFGVDPRRYLGLEGTAILSRYPILSARIVHLPQEYDWYHSEIGAISDFEKAEKWSAKKIFGERLARQVRRGGRIMLVVRLAVPGVPSGKLTVFGPHLEDYTTPKGRREQMDFILNQMQRISGPVVMVGDLNTLGHDGTPITFRRTLRKYLTDYRFWARQIVYFVQPVPGLTYAISAANYLKNYHDPTALDIPLFASNHSERLFSDLQQFRFDDGGRFDWQGRKGDSFRHKGRTLSDANERMAKGFAPTFSFRRTYHGLIGEYKIDWIFVKQPGRAANDPKEDRLLRSIQGRTLRELNKATAERISDHSPITAEIPLK